MNLFMNFHGVVVVLLLLINLECVGGFQFDKSKFVEAKGMKKIMFGNSLMLLALFIFGLTAVEVLYIGLVWLSIILVVVGFGLALAGYFGKDK